MDLLRSSSLLSNPDNTITKLPALVTQGASSQESVSTTVETVRNLTFDLDAVAHDLELVLVEGQDEFFDFNQSLKEWELNNVIRPQEEWLRLDQPENKAYE
jgi:hypothetical protein